MPQISHERRLWQQYDHAAKSFGYQVHKREAPVPARRDEAAWILAGGKFGWEVKKEAAPDAVLVRADMKVCAHERFNQYSQKRAEELASAELTGDAPLPPQCVPHLSWNIKRDQAPDYVVVRMRGDVYFDIAHIHIRNTRTDSLRRIENELGMRRAYMQLESCT